MKLGAEKLFDNLLDKPLNTGVETSLSELRNGLIVDRYYYYLSFTDKRYSAILAILKDEFFLAERTITNILDHNYKQLKTVKTQAPQKTHLKRKWPHLNWEI